MLASHGIAHIAVSLGPAHHVDLRKTAMDWS